MKHLLTILCVLTSFTALAQFPNTHTQSNPYTKEVFNGSVNPKKGLINGRYADTAEANLDYVAQEPGAQIIVGNTLYIRDITKTKWVTVGEYGLTASNITILNDSSISICNINNCDTFKFTNIIVNNFSVLNDSTIIVCDGNNTCDTLHIAPTQFAKSYVDSIKINGSLIYYYINGNAVLAGVIGGKDGLISGGIVTWSGQGLKFYITPAQYILGGKFYNSPLDSVVLDPANTQSRVDLFIVDTTSRSGKITGIADGNLLTPQIDPASQIALTSGIQINPGDTVPSNITTTVIYDEDLQHPSEWDTSRYGAISVVDFANTAKPKNGAKDMLISSYHTNTTIVFSTTSFETLTQDQTVSLWVYLNGYFKNNIYALLYNSTTKAITNWIPISSLINKYDSTKYQKISFNTSNFTWTGDNQGTFNTIEFRLVGSDTIGTKGLYIDWVTLQKGINSIPPQTDYSNKQDSTTFKKLIVGSDTANITLNWIKGVSHPKDTIWTGGTGSTGNTKYVLQGYGTIIDSSDANHYTVSIDTTRLKDSLYAGRGIKVDTTTYPNHTLLVVDSNYVRDTSLHLDGGTTNQILKKNSSTNGDWSWQDESGSGSTDTTSLSNRIDAKQDALTLTTTGTSGAATLSGATLNIPQYSGGGGGSATGVDSTNTATSAGQTVFTFPYTLTYYTVSKQVTRNGVLIDPSDYTVNTGNITFTGFTCDAGDKIRFIGVK